jgi:hypothetical protein
MKARGIRMMAVTIARITVSVLTASSMESKTVERDLVAGRERATAFGGAWKA